LCISASEPETVVHRLKRGRGFAAAYKPSVLANDAQIITALAVDVSSETAVVAQLLARIFHHCVRFGCERLFSRCWRSAPVFCAFTGRMRGFQFMQQSHPQNTRFRSLAWFGRSTSKGAA